MSAIVITVSIPSYYIENCWNWLVGTGDAQESGSAIIRNLGLVLAGIIALPLAIWRSVVASKHVTITHQSLLNEQYQKAAEMLGNENLSVRLGGIYVLQGLTEEHTEQYYVSCMKLLCALVRNPPKDENLTPLPDREMIRHDGELKLRADVQTVMDMMKSRDDKLVALEQDKGFVIDFRGADLRGANLLIANLAKVDLRGADMAGADATGARLSYAGLSGARLYKTVFASADFSNARFYGVDLSRTWFCGRDIMGGRRFSSPAVGISVQWLQYATAKKGDPPIFGDVVLDAETGRRLVWNRTEGLAFPSLED